MAGSPALASDGACDLWMDFNECATVDTDGPGGTRVMLRDLRHDDAGRHPRLTQARRKPSASNAEALRCSPARAMRCCTAPI
ncbi:hypothetical protein ASD08_24225 [Streptomyces sp. Root369]|nr:hypothetical protein ASD08_24225 [Streptomyces sp. Root369]